MDLLFEYCFYAGILLTAFGVIWLLRTLAQGRIRKIGLPFCVALIGVALILGPGIISRMTVVDLGPRDTMVDDERHITLTGWDRKDYSLLRRCGDTVVLQMANADVTDQTLDHLLNMSQLRELDLNDTLITDEGLRKLAKLPGLTTLRLRGTAITDAGFRDHLMGRSALAKLDLRQTSVTGETVSQWKRAGDNRSAFQ